MHAIIINYIWCIIAPRVWNGIFRNAWNNSRLCSFLSLDWLLVPVLVWLLLVKFLVKLSVRTCSKKFHEQLWLLPRKLQKGNIIPNSRRLEWNLNADRRVKYQLWISSLPHNTYFLCRKNLQCTHLKTISFLVFRSEEFWKCVVKIWWLSVKLGV